MTAEAMPAWKHMSNVFGSISVFLVARRTGHCFFSLVFQFFLAVCLKCRISLLSLQLLSSGALAVNGRHVVLFFVAMPGAAFYMSDAVNDWRERTLFNVDAHRNRG